MDDDIPSIELKLSFQDLNNHVYFSISLAFYLIILLVISTLIYIYIKIFEKLNPIFWNHRDYIDHLL